MRIGIRDQVKTRARLTGKEGENSAQHLISLISDKRAAGSKDEEEDEIEVEA